MSQISAILYKNTIIDLRSKADLLKETIIPVFCGLIIYSTCSNYLLKSAYISPWFTLIMLPLYLPTSIAGFSRKLLYEMVYEKNEKYKEYQKIMGMSPISYIIGYLISFYIKGVVIALIISVSVFASGFGIEKSFLVLFSYLLYVISTTHQVLFLTSFFSKPEASAEIGTFILSLASSLFYLVYFKYSDSTIILVLSCIFPQAAVTIYVVKICGFSLGLWDAQIEPSMALFMLAFDCLLYLVLYIYCDAVIPNEYGVNRHPLYPIIYVKSCFQKLIRKLYSQERIQFLNVEMNEGLNNIGETNSFSDPSFSHAIDLAHSEKEINSKVIIRGLTKNFGDLKAVDNLSFSMISGQLLWLDFIPNSSLLGHNGAGKTTTINLMTDFGKDFENNRDEIRKGFGFCPQKDIIYSKLTTREHLHFVGKIKEFSFAERNAAIQDIASSLELHSFLDQEAGTLSGGQKRRLSLGMSLVGDSKLIFLDEPTSGLDPLSRDELWKLIRRLKDEGKTLLLTTHYLEEADCLADNVLILSNGRHYMEGSPDEIKKELCTGYTLTIFGLDKSNDSLVTSLELLMEEFGIFDKKEYFNSKKFTLPFAKQPQFAQLFRRLEQLQEQNSFEFSLEMHTLEDAFLQIGQDTNPVDNLDINSNSLSHPRNMENPVYSFRSQVIALFTRKVYSSFRKLSNVFMMLLPIVYILIGSFVQNYMFVMDEKTSHKPNMKPQADFYTLAIFIIQGYCFKSSIFLILPVLEKETRIKQLLLVSGCRRLTYWAGNFLFDIFAYGFGVAIFFVSMILLNQKALLVHIGFLSKSLICFGPSLVMYSYCASFIFSKSTTAYKIFPLLNFFLMYMVPSILSQVFSFNPNLKDYLLYIEIPFIFLSPFFLLDKLLGKLSVMETSYFASENSYLIFLIMQFGVFTIILIALEHTKSTLSTISTSESYFTVSNLSKKYPNSKSNAVKNLSLSINKGDILGVLGPNGAGKSTTFNSILGIIPRDSGDLFIEGKSIQSLLQIHSLFNSLVLQDDCLWAHMTPEEHISFYCALKGLPHQDHFEISILKEFGLTDYIGKYSDKLSGGTKRKLSIALANLINPHFLILDEPTTGVDIFIKKRFYSRMLSLKDSAILLTTHSLAECEILCNKVAIIFKGEIVEAGEINEVKKKFNESIRLTLKVKNLSELKIWVANKYIGQKLLEEQNEHYSCLNFNISEKMSAICEQVNEMLESNLISDFSITQSTLQQVFVRICQEQEDEVEIVN